MLMTRGNMFTQNIDRDIQFQLAPTFEFRERFERRINRDFSNPANDNRSDAFSRLRVGGNWKYGPHWSGSTQLQYAHDTLWTAKKNASAEFRDVTLAYVAYQAASTTYTLGRQKIAIGSERLIGPLEWSNFSQVFDGVRAQTPSLDIFAFSIALAVPTKYKARVVGANYKGQFGESLGIYKHDKTAAGYVDIATLSHHWTANRGKVSVEIEAAAQFGKVGGASLEAWAWHSRAAYKLTPAVSVYAEVNSASGGQGKKIRTFDNLYPTNHKFYGSADMQAWKNMNELELGVEYKPNASVDLKVHFHGFGLRNASDGWYGAGGGINTKPGGTYLDVTGASGRDVGTELDFDATYRVNKNWTASAGIGLFNPGSFVRRQNGGAANQQLWGYLSLQYKF